MPLAASASPCRNVAGIGEGWSPETAVSVPRQAVDKSSDPPAKAERARGIANQARRYGAVLARSSGRYSNLATVLVGIARQSIRYVFVPSFLVLLPSFGSVAQAEDSGRATATDGGRTSASPVATGVDTSMLTGSGLNTKPWPIDRPAPGGVIRKLPGHRDWEFVRAMSDGEMRRTELDRQVELLREHGNEPRDIELLILDSLALRKLPRFEILASCVPPCTLRVRVLYRQLPLLQQDSLVISGLADRSPITPRSHEALHLKPRRANTEAGK